LPESCDPTQITIAHFPVTEAGVANAGIVSVVPEALKLPVFTVERIGAGGEAPPAGVSDQGVISSAI
jgi:hypothetical protein